MAQSPTLTPGPTAAGSVGGGAVAFTTSSPSNAVLAAVATAGDGRVAAAGSNGSGISRPGSGSQTGSVQLTGYSMDVPPGSVLVSARLRVTHREWTTRTGTRPPSR